MSWHAVLAIVRKDLATVVRNRGVRLPLLITPIVILIVLPTVLVTGVEMLVTDTSVPLEAVSGSPLSPGGGEDGTGSSSAEGLDAIGQWSVYIIEVFLAPLFLLVPLIVATVIAADSFAGERERGTLEALLHTPTSDRELLTGKFLASWLPAVTVALVGFMVYSMLANVLAYPSVGRIFFPTPTWLVLAFWVAPGLAALGLAIMVIASSRVQSLQAAHQIGSLVVLPIVLLLVAQIAGVMMFRPSTVAAMGAAIWVAAVGMLASGMKTLRRQQLALRL